MTTLGWKYKMGVTFVWVETSDDNKLISEAPSLTLKNNNKKNSVCHEENSYVQGP